MFDWLWHMFSGKSTAKSPQDLAARLNIPLEELQEVDVRYREFSISKRHNGTRRIHAPNANLKRTQRAVLKRVLQGMPIHPAATGFRRRHSIVTNAKVHCGQAVVIRMDIKDFFPSTSEDKVQKCLRRLGWNRAATALLLQLCTHDGRLPQGAPTSPCLSNLVNYRMDSRLAALAAHNQANYTRYADDITFSLNVDNRAQIKRLLGMAPAIVNDEGYRINRRKRVHVRRQHQQQMVTGLVVNQNVTLPRSTRRWLRAVEHRFQSKRQTQAFELSVTPGTRRTPTISKEQLAGWRSLRKMIDQQATY